MIVEISIAEFAIIDRTTIQFGTGLNVITGETGAGKSILVDALGAVLGDRVSADLVRARAERATVDAVFSVDGQESIQSELEELGILASDGEVVLSREISVNGRSVARINGRPVTVAALKRIGSGLVDIHGQSEHLTLLQPEVQMRLLDDHGVDRALILLTSRAHAEWRKASDTLDRLITGAREMAQRIDLLSYQVAEIEGANLSVDEEELLLSEISRLSNSAQIGSDLHTAVEALASEGEVVSASDALRVSAAALHRVAGIDSGAVDLATASDGLAFTLDDLVLDIRRYAETVEDDPSRLSEATERLELIRQLKRKYGNSIREILGYLGEARDERERLTIDCTSEEHLRQRVDVAWDDLVSAAAALSESRREAADELAIQVNTALADLNLGDSSFSIQVESLGGSSNPEDNTDIESRSISASGGDVVTFLFAPNEVESPKALSRIASGGEISRVMLALKSVIAPESGVSTLIFDEVDVGIGGRSGHVVGQKLAVLAESKQVVAITHLPQVAVYAAEHFKIGKISPDGRTVSHVSKLNPEDRVDEIALMLDGEPVSEASRTKAVEMLSRVSMHRLPSDEA